MKNPAPQKASIFQSAIKRKNIIKWFSKKTVDDYDSEDDDDSEYHEKPTEKHHEEVCTCFIQ